MVQVEERGTEAAAVTAILMEKSAFIIRQREPELNLRFDRPFAFAVAHRPSGTALFVGEVQAPEAWGQTP